MPRKHKKWFSLSGAFWGFLVGSVGSLMVFAFFSFGDLLKDCANALDDCGASSWGFLAIASMLLFPVFSALAGSWVVARNHERIGESNERYYARGQSKLLQGQECSVCGGTNFTTAKFCTRCGNSLAPTYLSRANSDWSSIDTVGVIAGIVSGIGISLLVGASPVGFWVIQTLALGGGVLITRRVLKRVSFRLPMRTLAVVAVALILPLAVLLLISWREPTLEGFTVDDAHSALMATLAERKPEQILLFSKQPPLSQDRLDTYCSHMAGGKPAKSRIINDDLPYFELVYGSYAPFLNWDGDPGFSVGGIWHVYPPDNSGKWKIKQILGLASEEYSCDDFHGEFVLTKHEPCASERVWHELAEVYLCEAEGRRGRLRHLEF